MTIPPHSIPIMIPILAHSLLQTHRVWPLPKIQGWHNIILYTVIPSPNTLHKSLYKLRLWYNHWYSKLHTNKPHLIQANNDQIWIYRPSTLPISHLKHIYTTLVTICWYYHQQVHMWTIWFDIITQDQWRTGVGQCKCTKSYPTGTGVLIRCASQYKHNIIH